MSPKNTIADTCDAGRASERVFTVTTANRALVLVRKVVRDIVEHYDRLMRLRAEREELAEAVVSDDRLEKLRAQTADTIDTLNVLSDELGEVGCELKDWATGLVDFPARRAGRKVWLCWKLGEPEITHWHEYDTGFSGRQPIGDDFE